MAIIGRRKKRIKITTYGEFLVLFPCCDEAERERLLEVLKDARKPAFLGKKSVPADLNTITYGQLDDLSRIDPEKEDPAVRILSILMGLDPIMVYELNVFDVLGVLNFINKEIERINGLFLSIKISHSSEEIAAGVDDLNFGTFGVIDWYARRMGITNQDEVYRVAWVRIYTCMRNDNLKSEYETRLSKQYIDKSKRKRR